MSSFILSSGGLDSTVLAYFLKYKEGINNLSGIYINSGQPNRRREYRKAKDFGKNLNIKISLFDIRKLYNSFRVNGVNPIEFLTIGGVDPDEDPPEEPDCGDPQIQILLASVLAIAKGAENIYIGAHKDDLLGSTPILKLYEHYQSVLRMIPRSGFDKFSYKLSFIEYSKAEILKLGKELGVPLERTWTCWNGRKYHCGNCSGCRIRKKAFETAGIVDNTKYGSHFQS